MATVVPITWSSGDPPTAYCIARGYKLWNVWYGYPSAFQCLNADGSVALNAFTTPTCPANYAVSFTELRCIPLESGLDALLNLPVADAVALSWLIASLWVTAWAIKQVALVIKEKSDVEEN